ncbi:MAG: Fe-S cluster assembly sulfur transfer protein SufU [Verrucomicrobiota bacterium]
MALETEIFREILLDHGQHPRGEGLLDSYDVMLEGSNSDTGDVVRLSIRLRDGVIDAVGFKAQGSAVLRASCSLMIELITGMAPKEAKDQAARFRGMLTGEIDDCDWVSMGDAQALQGIRQFPARVRCAALPWRTLADLDG